MKHVRSAFIDGVSNFFPLSSLPWPLDTPGLSFCLLHLLPGNLGGLVVGCLVWLVNIGDLVMCVSRTRRFAAPRKERVVAVARAAVGWAPRNRHQWYYCYYETQPAQRWW